MKKIYLLPAFCLTLSLMLCGCAGNTNVQANSPSKDDAPTPNTPIPEGTPFECSGPYGTIKITIPDDLNWEVKNIGEAETGSPGIFGFGIAPSGSSGLIEVLYQPMFGVCGTGLVQEEKELAGCTATFGYYDGNKDWSYIAFRGNNEKIVAQAISTDSWNDKIKKDALSILNTVSFDATTKAGSVFVFGPESELIDIGLSLSLKDISNTKATLVFQQWDSTFNGELSFGDDFSLFVKTGDTWSEAPIVLEGDYGFNAIAYNITNDGITESEVNWDWLYGSLAPGEYRITKSVMNYRAPGDFDKYEISADFIIN